MKPFPIPVVPFGPGSQAEDENLDYMPMPKDMSVYLQPALPDAASQAAAPRAHAVLQQITQALAAAGAGEGGTVIDITGLPAPDRQVINQVLGEGEVSAKIELDADAQVHVQESVFAGVWRLITLRGEVVTGDHVEIGPVPRLFVEAAAFDLWPDMPEWAGALPPNVVNAPALLHEVRDQLGRWLPGQTPHVINLTLLPVSMEDIAFLDHHLGTGGLLVLSRGYGNCRISSTRLRHCWRVVYYNSADSVILNSVEITDMPDVATAAPEDMRDAHERLADILCVLSETE